MSLSNLLDQNSFNSIIENEQETLEYFVGFNVNNNQCET